MCLCDGTTARRRSYLYLGGALGSTLSFLVMLSFFNIFFRSQIAFDIQLVGARAC